MLKILDDMMKNENDKWLEEQLKSKPEIADDDFVARVMNDVDTSHASGFSRRKVILFSTYLFSFVIFAFVTPWEWLSTKLSAGRLELLSSFSSSAEMQSSIMTISIIFIVSFFAVVLGLEQS